MKYSRATPVRLALDILLKDSFYRCWHTTVVGFSGRVFSPLRTKHFGSFLVRDPDFHRLIRWAMFKVTRGSLRMCPARRLDGAGAHQRAIPSAVFSSSRPFSKRDGSTSSGSSKSSSSFSVGTENYVFVRDRGCSLLMELTRGGRIYEGAEVECRYVGAMHMDIDVFRCVVRGAVHRARKGVVQVRERDLVFRPDLLARMINLLISLKSIQSS